MKYIFVFSGGNPMKPVLMSTATIWYSKSIINLIKFDKKSKDGKVLFVLLYEIGKSKIDIEVPKEKIIESLDFYSS